MSRKNTNVQPESEEESYDVLGAYNSSFSENEEEEEIPKLKKKRTRNLWILQTELEDEAAFQAWLKQTKCYSYLKPWDTKEG